jgi:hypothetical protein
MIELLQERDLSAECITLAIELVATHARFNFWVGMDVKRRASAEQISDLVDQDNALDETCRVGVARFKADRDEATLRCILADVIGKYNELFTR